MSSAVTWIGQFSLRHAFKYHWLRISFTSTLVALSPPHVHPSPPYVHLSPPYVHPSPPYVHPFSLKHAFKYHWLRISFTSTLVALPPPYVQPSPPYIYVHPSPPYVHPLPSSSVLLVSDMLCRQIVEENVIWKQEWMFYTRYSQKDFVFLLKGINIRIDADELEYNTHYKP